MEDLKKIQEFFSKPLNENAFVEAFKFEKALKGMGYDVKVKYLDDFGKDVYEIYFNNPADADESIFYDAKKLGYDNVRVFANPQESLDEAKEELPKKTFFSILKDIKNLALKLAKDNAREASQYIKPGKATDMSPMADIAKVQQDLIGQAQLDEGIKDAINNITKFSGAGSLLTGGGYLLSYIDQLELKYYQWYYSAIKNMADFEIFELLKNKYGIEEQISAWEQKVLMYAFFVFFTIFVVAIGAKLVSKASDKFIKEATKEEETKFHAKLDKLVHDTFGKRKGEMEERFEMSWPGKYVVRPCSNPGTPFAVWKTSEGGENDKRIEGFKTKEEAQSFADRKNQAAYIAETIKLGLMVNEELCDKGKRYIKARQAAGEKSSAYLSGRAVRVCKGQIEWPKKGKKK